MAQDLTISNQAFGAAALPAHLAHLADKPSEIVTSSGPSVPTLSIRGKTFSINDGGDAKPLMKTDPDTQEEVPISALSLVIVDYGTKNGRQYYEGTFDPKESKPPTCFSLDGVVPEDDSEVKQHPKCATCPKAQKGSKVSEQSGKAVAACANNRNLAVIPVATLDGQVPLMKLKLAQTSIYDGKSPELRKEGKFAFENYLQALKAKKIPSVDAIVTVVAFDTTPGLTYPKLVFRAARYLTSEEYAKVQAIKASGKVDEILDWTSTLALSEGRAHRPEPTGDDAGAHPADAALARAGANNPALSGDTMGRKAANQTTAVVDEDPEDKAIREAQERKAAKARAAAEAAAAAAKPAAAVAPSKSIGAFVAPVQEADEDEDDYNIRVAQARKAHRLAEAAALAAKPAAEFVAPKQKDGEDEDDYNIRVAQARKAWKAQQAAAAPKAVPEFVVPPQDPDEDEDDYNIRVATARKAHKAKHGAPAAAAAPAKPMPPKAPRYVAPDQLDGEDEDDYNIRAAQTRKAYKAQHGMTPEEVGKLWDAYQGQVKGGDAEKPTRTRRTKEQIAADAAAAGGEKFLPEEAAKAKLAADISADEPATGKAKIEPTAAIAVPGVSDEVSSMLTGWNED